MVTSQNRPFRGRATLTQGNRSDPLTVARRYLVEIPSST
ncbi:hypothetical protein QFZ69_004618 [Arthrobacter sp. V1I7]|nr:hypothetical protein [Arthrobacter sp. V1I7]MDQ0823672.1 hypothetical protein [Arthrobacter sp. V1I7]